MVELLKVVSVEKMSDKDGIEYKRIQVRNGETSFIQLPTGEWKEIKQLSRTTYLNAWPQHERNGMSFREDPAYELEEGDETAGKIVTREVPAYDIVDRISGETREATRYTAAIFADSTDKESFEAAVRSTFMRNGHDLDATFNTSGVAASPRVQSIAKEEVKANAELA